jgi:co-chaperonin GroES (HSP10)
LSNLILSQADVTRQLVADKKRREAAIAASMSAGTTNALMSDDFASKDDVTRQLLQLQEYLDSRREQDPAYHLPKPSGWRIQVLMLTIPETTSGGLHVIDENREARSMASPQGVILAIGPGAYRDPARFEVNGVLTPWHAVGDRIQFVKYDAQPFQLPNGQRLGILTDTQPVALLDSGWEVPA